MRVGRTLAAFAILIFGVFVVWFAFPLSQPMLRELNAFLHAVGVRPHVGFGNMAALSIFAGIIALIFWLGIALIFGAWRTAVGRIDLAKLLFGLLVIGLLAPPTAFLTLVFGQCFAFSVCIDP
jgi:hypothetical protein